jgi:hypothetical protein
MDYEKDLATT